MAGVLTYFWEEMVCSGRGGGEVLCAGRNMPRPQPPSRGIVKSRLGGVHYVTSGSFNSPLLPMIAFHTSSRSADEFAEVMPLVSEDGRLMIAIDELGHGSSDNPSESCNIGDLADCATVVLENLGVEACIACGSFTGNMVALALASRHTKRVRACILTNCYYSRQAKEKPWYNVFQDDFEPEENGSHLIDIFNRRKSWLNPQMNSRVTRDDLIYKLKREERQAMSVAIEDPQLYHFERAARGTLCPVFCVQGKEATAFFGLGEMPAEFEGALPLFANVSMETIDGHINCINTHPDEWWSEVLPFLHEHEL